MAIVNPLVATVAEPRRHQAGFVRDFLFGVPAFEAQTRRRFRYNSLITSTQLDVEVRSHLLMRLRRPHPPRLRVRRMLRQFSVVFFAGIAFVALAITVQAQTPENDFPAVINTQPLGESPSSPQKAAEKITVPAGFEATLFAGEPQVNQPISMSFDDQGRLWVVECYSYAERGYDERFRDRIIILDDTNGDGRHDQRTVFWDQGLRLTSALVGHGGVWILNDGKLQRLKDEDQDDRADPGEAETFLEGFAKDRAQHNIVNGLMWGPDGWLYGRHGITASSTVGRLTDSKDQRIELNCSIWRFHPITHRFEVVTHGTTNPWGMDYNDRGELFFTNNVIGHLWHVVPGAHYQRMFGEDFNPHLYELIDQTADHYHWDNRGGNWTDSRSADGKHGELGGGHSHCGGMIYLGDRWPEKYRNRILMCNTHGRRVNQNVLERAGCSYVGRAAPDFLLANNPWFRGVDLKYGPDGDVYLSDWTDLGECHDNDGVHRTSGRIYKITYGKPLPKPALLERPLAGRSDAELLELLGHRNDWFVRRAQRLLQERSATGKDMAEVHKRLREQLHSHPEVTRRLRVLWTLHVTGGADTTLLLNLLKSPEESLRCWAVRLLTETAPEASVVERLATLAEGENSGLVRLYLASALQRVARDPEGLLADVPALDGYCPVELARKKAWKLGNEKYQAEYLGRNFHFLDQENRQAFLADPEKFAPMIAGFDPVALVESGELRLGKRRHGAWYNSQIFLHKSEATLQRFTSDPEFFAPKLKRIEAEFQQRFAAKTTSKSSVAFWKLATALADHEDGEDRVQPLMIWYGIEPAVVENATSALLLMESTKIALLRRHIARRLTARLDRSPESVDELLVWATRQSPAIQLDVLKGMAAALNGWRRAERPKHWTSFRGSLTADAESQQLGKELTVVFGDGREMAELKTVIKDSKKGTAERRNALRVLMEAKPEGFAPTLQQLLGDRSLNDLAVAGLAQYDHPETAAKILAKFGQMRPPTRTQAISTLSSRKSYAVALLRSVQKGQVDRAEISADQARQMAALDDDEVSRLLAEAWGAVRTTPKEKARLLDSLKRKLTPEKLAEADPRNGHRLFLQHCGSCHRLFGEGKNIAPDLTGGNRDNLHYLLHNLVDPSAVVPAAYRVTKLRLEDGRVINGVIVRTEGPVLRVQTAKELLTVQKDEIAERQPSELSLMPDNLNQLISDQQMRDLVSYLQLKRPLEDK